MNPEPSAKTTQAARTGPKEATEGTLLIVDDNAINRLLLTITFKNSPYKLIEAQDGKDALKKLKANKDIKVILLDLNMPLMDGYDFLNYINANMGLKDLPLFVVIVTASSQTEFNQAVVKRNINTQRVVQFYSKPLELGKLKATVDSLIKNKKIET
jgi:CheY-like chemotaxis protein